MRARLTTAVAIVSGLIILAGYFYSIPLLQSIRSTMLDWSVIVAGVALLVGVANLLGVHWRKFVRRQPKDLYSPFLILAFAITFAAGLWFGPANAVFQQFVLAVQVPVEASLLAVMSVTLLLACMRLLRQRRDMMAVLFILSTVVFLVGASNLLSLVLHGPMLIGTMSLLNRLPAAGARGILLGVALGTLTTGLRILLGSDRPYNG